MENYSYKSTGIALITGAILIIFTMILHPAGGNIEHIIKISQSIRITHSLAILSLPIVLFGFYGLTIALLDKWKLSILAFIIISFGLIAAMFAALVNGLTLPHYLNQYATKTEENLEVLQPIINYGFALNIPLDYIFIVACCIAILVYSIIILAENKYPKWIGNLGIFITIFAIIGGGTDFVFTSLTGFRIFTFSIAAWILSIGLLLFKTKSR
ncbi:hypothetical protein J8L88_05965 [Aquimarina sp. MMG015]|uniref:hypothetical protein n=1 Tax=unclassified Aquimarina TaxID=2627091 RepID=UPI000E4F77A2|nr:MULTISPECIES: hypothetical protein [unclassified Aquimarina]AXT55423.1 hypothetical protein D1815_06490 [Aquimarina sp. AD1]MBQ4802397.1 hypothetical protein [Aquimarina sp. MMG015]RKN03482.1 hypothetical protein D7035_22280 [Aquimarina sp. AD1]